MLDVKCIMVAAGGGARADFVAGWLGTLPNFVESHWHIKPDTGQSVIAPNFSKFLDHNPCLTLRQELQNYSYNLAPSTYTIALPFHGRNYKNQIESADLESSIVKLLKIVADEKDAPTIYWEFVCKTFLSEHKKFTQPQTSDPIRALAEFQTFRVQTHDNIPTAINIEYGKLFTPGGSYYLSDQLGLVNVPTCYHRYYDAMLNLAITPDEIYSCGKLWRKQDYPYIRH